MIVDSVDDQLKFQIWDQTRSGAKWSILQQDSNYKISSFGLIVRGNHTITDKSGKRIPLKAKLIKAYISNPGYPAVDIKNQHLYIHRLLAQHFIPNPHNKPYVNHKNGIKTDNRLCNLEWCTASENNQHAYDTGLKHYAPRKPKSI